MDVVERLRSRGIQPSAQRVAVGEYVLSAGDHPSADRIWEKVREKFPMISRATVYNTLHLFVEKGLLRQLSLAEGRLVYDPLIERHHHFIDEDTGEIRDVPWNSIQVRNATQLPGLEISDYQVVLRGRRSKG